jgi:putative endonuclease
MCSVSLGKIGENIARAYLQNKGYRIIHHNYRTRYAEIDLIASYKGKLVFIEVKTRTNEHFATPEESIDRRKLKKLIRSAKIYTAIHNYNKSYRIDAVCLVLDKSHQRIRRIDHYENISL